MHKHRSKQDGSGKRWTESNYSLPASVRHTIRDLFEGIDGEDEDLRYLKQEYLSKFCSADLTSAKDRKQAAITKWLATESQNLATNVCFQLRDPEFNILNRVSYSRFLRVARNFVSNVLGELSDELVLGSFSGGASTSRKRTESLPALKFIGQADVTQEAKPFVELIHHLSPLLRKNQTFFDLTEVEGAVLFTVPKKTDIDRCACKEPDINMFLQKGVGSHIRRRLRKFGIDLNDQSVNRELARVGSVSNTLATLDLSSASDTITIECVRALLPVDWFEYLNSIRSQAVWVEGTLVRTEMFSSMGNGFTFELESLIFWALMKTTLYLLHTPGIVSVYGDDIVIPSEIYDDACFVLKEFGFSTNTSKSFATGPFRESCGGHYYAGVDITPFYLKREAATLTDLIRVANQLRRWLTADPFRQFVHPAAVERWWELKALVPKDLWGGHDLSLDTQLVSDDVPKCKLVRVNTKVQSSDLGEYLAWHASNWNRSCVGTGLNSPLLHLSLIHI